jgi:hypothetical protein
MMIVRFFAPQSQSKEAFSNTTGYAAIAMERDFQGYTIFTTFQGLLVTPCISDMS